MANAKHDVTPEQEMTGDEMAEEITAAPQENPLEAELAAEKEKYLRLAAEYDNFRKRSIKERELLYSEIRADTITRILPVTTTFPAHFSRNALTRPFIKAWT